MVVGFDIENAKLRPGLAETSQQQMGAVDHEESQTDRIRKRCLVDVHKILKTPEPCIAEIKLNLEAQLVGVNQFVKGKVKVAAKEQHMRLALRRTICFNDDHDVESVCERLM